MDINKEREAFEQALVNQKNVSINNLHVCTIFDAEKNKYSPSDVCDPKEDFIVDWINSSWSIWQAAKAQAVPEGFVLVKKELPEQIAEKMAIDRIDKPRHENDPVWSEIAEQSYRDQVKSKKWEFWRDYKAMIEAQEPAND